MKKVLISAPLMNKSEHGSLARLVMNTLNEYQDNAMTTRLPSAGLEYALFGLGGEVGEIYSLLAKLYRDGTDDEAATVENIKKELGDILWFIAAIAKDYGFTLEEVAQKNLDKLKKRKQDGTIQGSGDNR